MRLTDLRDRSTFRARAAGGLIALAIGFMVTVRFRL